MIDSQRDIVDLIKLICQMEIKLSNSQEIEESIELKIALLSVIKYLIYSSTES